MIQLVKIIKSQKSEGVSWLSWFLFGIANIGAYFLAQNYFSIKVILAFILTAILDFIMSDDGQKVWANAFLRPIRASAMSKEAASKFLPASDYARSKPLDYAKMAAVQNSFKERYLNEVR